MPKIFISYRRDDSRKDAGRIYDRLVQAFGKDNVFKDIVSILPGSDFRGIINEAVNSCDVVLVVIGRSWLTVTDESGKRRLDNPNDFVRLEVQAALWRENAKVVPVLVDNAVMPRLSNLPTELQELAYRNAISVRDDPDFDHDVKLLVDWLSSGFKTKPSLPKWAIIIAVVGIIISLIIVALIINNIISFPTTALTEQARASRAAAETATAEVQILTDVQNTQIALAASNSRATIPAQVTPDTPTNTPQPTLTPTLSMREIAIKGVTSNAEWQPFSQEFNEVVMMLVPVGCFMMGSNDATDKEQPVSEQCFDAPFWIDRTEVTNAQFTRFEGQAGRESYWTDLLRPRESITWFQARNFCEKRGARLPTEAEWEYAARGPDNLIYPWGNDFNSDNVVYKENSDAQTANVGSKQSGASWVGTLDMSGNVWEWTSSIDQDYPYTGQDGREDENDNYRARVLRGGSWSSYPSFLRASNRLLNIPPSDRSYIGGFRCVRDYPF